MHATIISEFRFYWTIFDIRHVSGSNNVGADALSRIEELQTLLDYIALAASQQKDEELEAYLQREFGLQLNKVLIPGSAVSVYCDTATATFRPFLTKPYRRTAFNTVHNLAHSGIKSTGKLVAQRYVWPSMRSDCREWTRACIPAGESFSPCFGASGSVCDAVQEV